MFVMVRRLLKPSIKVLRPTILCAAALSGDQIEPCRRTYRGSGSRPSSSRATLRVKAELRSPNPKAKVTMVNTAITVFFRN